MNLRDFKIGWRMLINEPAYSGIVIAGLALGFASCFLLLGFVAYSFGYDSQVPDNKSVYTLQHKVNIVPTPQWMEFMPLPVRTVALNSGMASAASVAIPIDVTIQVDGHIFRDELTAVDSSFPSMWGVQALEGDLQSALSRPDAIALTVELAKKLFGDTNVIGKSMDVGGKRVQVVALLPDAPTNTTLPYSGVVGINTVAMTDDDRRSVMENWQGVAGKIYLKLNNGITPLQMTVFLQNAFDHSPWSNFAPPRLDRLGKSKVIEVRLMPVADAYFDMDVANNLASGPRANKFMVLTLLGLAFLILVIAAGNFINLASSRTVRRAREIALRKLLGASERQIVQLFLIESILVTFIATGIGLLLAWMLQPVFCDLVNRRMGNLFTPSYVIWAFVAGGGVGIISGGYPTWLALKIKPATALSGRDNANSSGALWLQRGLTLLQFAIGMPLVAVTVAIGWQTYFAVHSDPGFDTSQLVSIDMPGEAKPEDRVAFRQRLEQLTDVEAVTSVQKAIGDQRMGMATDFKRTGGKMVPSTIENIEPNFFDLYRIKPVLGRLFDSTIDHDNGNANLAVINANAALAYGFDTPQAALGKIIEALETGNSWTVIGIAPDIRHQSLRGVIQPTVYLLDSKRNLTLTVRARGKLTQVEKHIDSLWQAAFPAMPLKMRTAHAVYEEVYADDSRLVKTIAIASVVVIGLTSFGIYVLSAMNLQYRRREIVMRKLYGALSIRIIRLLSHDFLWLIFISAFVSLPIASIVISIYMAGFVERAPLGEVPILSAIGLAVLIVGIAMSRHILIAMRLKPASVLDI